MNAFTCRGTDSSLSGFSVYTLTAMLVNQLLHLCLPPRELAILVFWFGAMVDAVMRGHFFISVCGRRR
jgi:hypothetical protein